VKRVVGLLHNAISTKGSVLEVKGKEYSAAFEADQGMAVIGSAYIDTSMLGVWDAGVILPATPSLPASVFPPSP